MAYKNLLFEVMEGNVALVTLNRPQRLNALSVELREELLGLLDEVEANGDIKTLVFTGAPRADGRPCFSVGADIKEMKELGGTTIQIKTLGTLEEGIIKTLWATGEQRDFWQFVFNRLYSLTKPTIAAIDGLCIAGGLELALCCDFRVAATTAQILDLHMKNLGILGGGGLQTHLPALIGPMKTKELLWTGEEIDGQEAKDIGLVCRVYPPEKLIPETLNMARKLALNSPLAMKLSKMVINSSLSQTTFESLRFSALCEQMLRYMREEEFAKNVDAFAAR